MTAIPPGPPPGAAAGASPAAGADPRQQLRKASHQLEGVFLSYLFRAMRATVPTDGLFAPSSGETLLTSMLDDELAQAAAGRLQHGMGDALYNQLGRDLPPGAPAAPHKP
ncbi:MAG TPA: rod-binding protein [Gemmatimonadales bacterium]|nr:rod-binding protein [Gemmatimonadales bacterium]